MMPLIGIALCSSVLYVLVKKYSPEFAVLVEVGSVLIILLITYPYICDVVDFFSSSAINGEQFKLLLKITGIAVLTQFACDICSDSGESALASKVEFSGKIIILAMSLPIVKTLLDFATGLIK